MKNGTKTAIALALIALGLVVPAAASGHKLPMSYARYYATDVAINWELSGPDLDTFWVDTCWRYSQHKVSCDANVQGTHYGDLHCGYTSCWSTDTTTTCWRRVWAMVRGSKVRHRVSYSHCSSSSHTTRY